MTFELWWETQHAEECRELAERAWAAAVKAERERCADVCVKIALEADQESKQLRATGLDREAEFAFMEGCGADKCAEAICVLDAGGRTP